MNRVTRMSVLSALALPALALAETWNLDSSHTSAQFAVKHMMISMVRGDFGKTTGTIELDEKDLAKSTALATIDVSTLNTREPKRDAHLKSADFFEVEKFPSMTFKSTRFQKAGANKYKVVGNLTIRDVTKEVALDVVLAGKGIKDPYGNTRQGAIATTRINRGDYGLKWNAPMEAGGLVVGDEVQITIDLEMIKKQPEKS